MEGKTADNNVHDLVILQAIVKYCFVIICVPITTFFASKCIIFDSVLGLDSLSSNIYSAVIAVVFLHIALGLYIYRAYEEGEKQPKPVKGD